MIDLGARFARDLPPPAGRWQGFARYNFIGGHNDPEIVPVDALIAAAERALRREGRALATYNLGQGASATRACARSSPASSPASAASPPRPTTS
jgi:hypothetical protein